MSSVLGNRRKATPIAKPVEGSMLPESQDSLQGPPPSSNKRKPPVKSPYGGQPWDHTYSPGFVNKAAPKKNSKTTTTVQFTPKTTAPSIKKPAQKINPPNKITTSSQNRKPIDRNLVKLDSDNEDNNGADSSFDEAPNAAKHRQHSQLQQQQQSQKRRLGLANNMQAPPSTSAKVLPYAYLNSSSKARKRSLETDDGPSNPVNTRSFYSNPASSSKKATKTRQSSPTSSRESYDLFTSGVLLDDEACDCMKGYKCTITNLPHHNHLLIEIYSIRKQSGPPICKFHSGDIREVILSPIDINRAVWKFNLTKTAKPEDPKTITFIVDKEEDAYRRPVDEDARELLREHVLMETMGEKETQQIIEQLNAIFNQPEEKGRSKQKSVLEHVQNLPTRRSSRTTTRQSTANIGSLADFRPFDTAKRVPGGTKVILAYPISGPRPISITRDDYNRLDDGEFLNDTIVDYGLRRVLDRLEQKDPHLVDDIYLFNTFFYTTLTNRNNKSEDTYQRVSKWTSKVNLFRKKFIIVPINEHLHWYLSIIVNPARILEPPTETDENVQREKEREKLKRKSSLRSTTLRLDEEDDEAEKEQQQQDQQEKESSEGKSNIDLSAYDSDEEVPQQLIPPKPESKVEPGLDPDGCWIFTFDSLGGFHRAVVSNLKEYLGREAKDKLNIENPSNAQAKGREVKVPKQPNFSDCGLHLIHNAEIFLNNYQDLIEAVLSKNRAKDYPQWDFETTGTRRETMRHEIDQFSKEWQELNMDNNDDSDDEKPAAATPKSSTQEKTESPPSSPVLMIDEDGGSSNVTQRRVPARKLELGSNTSTKSTSSPSNTRKMENSSPSPPPIESEEEFTAHSKSSSSSSTKGQQNDTVYLSDDGADENKSSQKTLKKGHKKPGKTKEKQKQSQDNNSTQSTGEITFIQNKSPASKKKQSLSEKVFSNADDLALENEDDDVDVFPT